MTKRSDYRAVLESLPPGQWLPYLDSESGLPGPRGNIELAEAFADVAVAAAPAPGMAHLERWAASRDKDVRWILRGNLKKARLARVDPAGAARLAAMLDERGQ